MPQLQHHKRHQTDQLHWMDFHCGFRIIGLFLQFICCRKRVFLSFLTDVRQVAAR